MADSTSETDASRAREERGWPGVKAVLFQNKYDSALWLLRLYAVGCAFFFMIPVFGSQFSFNCYRRVILASATISALRLHQRLPRFQFNRQYFSQLLQEDAFHYLGYSVLFLMAQPTTLALIPVVMFAVLHAAAFSRKVIEASGSDSFPVPKLRLLVAKVENRETQQAMLQFIASSEIMMMPVTILMLFSGQASFLVPFFYYRFVQLRYTSRRNPYSRLMFHQMRLGIQTLACNPRCPAMVQRLLYSFIGLISRLAPATQAQPA